MISKFDEYLSSLGLVADKWTEPNHNGWVNPYIDGKIHFGFREVKGGFEVNDFREGKIFTISNDQKFISQPTKINPVATEDFMKEFLHAERNMTQQPFKRLEKKGVTKRCAFVYNNNLYIPYYNKVGGMPVGCQVQAEDGKKWSIKGSVMSNAFTILQEGNFLDVDFNSLDRPMGFIAEGYTTACQIADLLPDAFVACAAGMGQIVNVYKKLHETYPELALTIALDKPKKYHVHRAMNNIVETLDKMRIPFIQPDKDHPKLHKATDFNDCVLILGKEYVLQYIIKEYNKVAPIMPEIMPKASSAHNIISYHRGGVITSIPFSRETELYKDLSPAMLKEYEEQNFTEGKIERKIVLDRIIKEFLHNKDNKETTFYGQGIYSEKSNFVYNMCGGRYVYSGPRGLHYDPRHRYGGGNYYVDVPYSRQLCLPLSKAITAKDMDGLSARFNKVYPNSKLLNIGLAHLIQASFAGFSDFRAHTWILGPTGAGKSLLRSIINNIGRGLTLMVQDVTKAGLAQMLNSDGVNMSPVILADETAADTEAKKKNIDEIIKSMRAMSNASDDTMSLRGTSEQKVKIYKTRASILLASTVSYIKDAQDKARIFELDIDHPVYKGKSEEIDELLKYSSELNEKWLVMLMNQAPNYSKFVTICEKYISRIYKHKAVSHKVRVYAALTAGLSCLLNEVIENKMSFEEIAKLSFLKIRQFFNVDYERQINFIEGSNNIIDRLINFNTVLNGANSRATLIEIVSNPIEADNLYRQYGIKINRNNKLIIRKSDYKLDRLLESRKLVIEPLYDSESLLKEAIAQQIEGIKEHPTTCSITKKKIRCYSIDIPEAKEENFDGVIPISKKSS